MPERIAISNLKSCGLQPTFRYGKATYPSLWVNPTSKVSFKEGVLTATPLQYGMQCGFYHRQAWYIPARKYLCNNCLRINGLLW